LEPFLVTVGLFRRIDWMTRIEFFRYRPVAWVLRSIGAYPVRRFGVPVSAIRTSIARLRHGRTVGVCPEGGVTVGRESVCRGGPIRGGASLIAVRAGVPIIPCVMLGTHKLNVVEPWLPLGRARVWMAFGQPVHPPADAPDRKAARRELNERLRRAFVALYTELRQQYHIDDRDVP
jgi:1-acyl-sn-glycerol-3-phosphate acyltransferase